MGRALSLANQARTDMILAVLRDAEGFPINTGDIANAVGWKHVGHDWNNAWCRKCRGYHPGPVWRLLDAQDIRGLLNRLAKRGDVEKIVLENDRRHYWRSVRPIDDGPQP